jgi:anti-sigma B factor antagonist
MSWESLGKCPACDAELEPSSALTPERSSCPRCESLFSWKRTPDALVVRMHRNEIDRETVNRLENLLKNQGGEQIILDFAETNYLSSATLGELVRLKKRVIAVGAELRLCGIHPDLRELFEITRLDRVFRIEWSN